MFNDIITERDVVYLHNAINVQRISKFYNITLDQNSSYYLLHCDYYLFRSFLFKFFFKFNSDLFVKSTMDAIGKFPENENKTVII